MWSQNIFVCYDHFVFIYLGVFETCYDFFFRLFFCGWFYFIYSDIYIYGNFFFLFGFVFVLLFIFKFIGLENCWCTQSGEFLYRSLLKIYVEAFFFFFFWVFSCEFNTNFWVEIWFEKFVLNIIYTNFCVKIWFKSCIENH